MRGKSLLLTQKSEYNGTLLKLLRSIYGWHCGWTGDPLDVEAEAMLARDGEYE